MGAKIPAEVAKFPITELLEKHGCKLFKGPGKVSEMRTLPGHPDLLAIVTLPRKSIFDFVLNGIFEGTDEVITAMTVLVQGIVLKELGIPTHLVAYGASIDQYLPPPLRNNAKLQKCALIVKKFKPEEVDDWEHIWRFNHTGSAITSLKETGMVYGHPVRADIKEGEAYDSPLYTPTTKEDDGHDRTLSRDEIASKHTKHKERTREVAMAFRKYFEERGIVAADLKLECSIEFAGIIYMLDKVGPDEFRAWDEEDRILAIDEGRAPKSMDKEILRKWGKGIKTPFSDASGDEWFTGINNLDPKNSQHITFVHNQIVPREVSATTIAAYFEIFRRLNDGKPLEDFQRDVMGIVV